MKTKILSIALALGLGASFTSCSNDLDVVQPSQFTSMSMWNEENDATSAVAGAYSLLKTAYCNSNDFWGDLRSNLWTSGKVNDPNYANTGKNQLNSSWSGTNWASLYTTINAANLILKHVDDIKFTKQETRNEVMAQAYFIRAYVYYTIARVWGDAPLVTSGYESENQDDMYPSRNPASELFAQIESDIENAVKLMPSNVKKIYQASPAAVNMLKADYYLWKASRLGGGQTAYQTALAAANTVINMDYALLDDFASVFKADNKNNKEMIFALPFIEGQGVTAGTSPNYYAFFLCQTEHTQKLLAAGYSLDDVPVGTHAQYSLPNDEYVDFLLKDDQDSRGAASVKRFTDPFIVDQCFCKVISPKFIGTWKNNTRVFDCDMPHYRLAEAYIFKAEAENGLGNTANAIAALNVLEKRARGVDNFYTGLDKNGVTNAIIDEVKMEFMAEGKTWWTYLRNNKEFEQIATLVGRENEQNITLWPVAQACINTNPNIKQTPGYF